MSSLTSTAEEILRLVDRNALHPDPSVNDRILITDIENAISRSAAFVQLKSFVKELEIEKRQLEREIEDLEAEIEDMELAENK